MYCDDFAVGFIGWEVYQGELWKASGCVWALYSFPEKEYLENIFVLNPKPASQLKIVAAEALKALVTDPINLTNHNNAPMPKTKQTVPFTLLAAVINNQNHQLERLITDQVHWLRKYKLSVHISDVDVDHADES